MTKAKRRRSRNFVDWIEAQIKQRLAKMLARGSRPIRKRASPVRVPAPPSKDGADDRPPELFIRRRCLLLCVILRTGYSTRSNRSAARDAMGTEQPSLAYSAQSTLKRLVRDF
jgi:hypothetical protein